MHLRRLIVLPSFVLSLCCAATFSADAEVAAPANTLSDVEQKSGWKLLFDGKTTDGWRNFQKDTIGDGWKVIDGALTRAGQGAGDIVTESEYGSFELSIEYRIEPGGNSGIMYHVSEEADKPWHTGPEIQILDNARGADPQKAGWLYQLYRAEEDATRPAGEWNHLYVKVAPGQCATYMNGVRYYLYDKGNAEWQRRVADSKFAKLPQFGKIERGHICLQDHGNRVAFRNIKLRELPASGEVPNPVDGELPLKPVLAFADLKWRGWSPVTDEGKVQPLRPIVVTHAGDGTNRVFVATQRGVIHVFPNRPDVKESKVYLDISDRVTYKDTENEEGFLGLAFHPNYKETGELYVYYTTKDAPHTSVISRFRVSKDDPDQADPASEEELLRIEQPFWNHNGGTVAFGPDGYLYIGLGDGGAANDPHDNGQDLGTLLGSILRVDVDRKDEGKAYAVPADNPFVDREGAQPEIWAYGLRNVWRLSFDRKTGTLWAADVGQNLWEEINIIERGGNFGWDLREGAHPFGAEGVDARKDIIEPIWEYDHEVGKSITGGVVYRGKKLPEIAGKYIYGDYITGKLWALDYNDRTGEVKNYSIPGSKLPVITFGEDERGEVYFTVVATDGRGLYTLERSE
ncbi:MAG: PQQ-dependent sugar dehydrogenase [Planctomycetes bacterium]|nr:PQQ-dependent sugar dehydrogenase [Planctomycetota bacterium]